MTIPEFYSKFPLLLKETVAVFSRHIFLLNSYRMLLHQFSGRVTSPYINIKENLNSLPDVKLWILIIFYSGIKYNYKGREGDGCFHSSPFPSL